MLQANQEAKTDGKNLDEKLQGLVARERRITTEISKVILLLDQDRLYRELGFSNLKDYLIKRIGYSETCANARIAAAKLMQEVPTLVDALENGEIKISQLAHIHGAIKAEEKAMDEKISREDKAKVVEMVKDQTIFETQKTLMNICSSYEPSCYRETPKRSGKIEVTLTFDEADWERIQNLKAQHSHAVPDLKLESLLLYFAERLEKKQARAVQRAKTHAGEKSEAESESASSAPKASASPKKFNHASPSPMENSGAKRRHVPSRIKIQIRERAQQRCEFVSPETGTRCDGRHFLEDEHIIPVALGGTNDPDNLRLYCRSHNQLAAEMVGLGRPLS